MIASHANEQLEERLLPPAALAALSEGDVGGAVRITSDAAGLNPMEARMLVDDYLQRNPAIRRQMERGRTSWRSDWIVSLVFVLLLWWAAVYVLS